MGTGIELIAEERQEQIEKHGWTLEHDAKYTNGELVQSAKFSEIATGRGIGFDGLEIEGAYWPIGWSNYFRRKIILKTKVQALAVAGAFYMAENDRLGENEYQEEINRVAAEIDRLQSVSSTNKEDQKIKCYELDFGDTNLISQNHKDITDWVETALKDLKEGDELDYTVTIKMLTQEEIDALPEWS